MFRCYLEFKGEQWYLLDLPPTQDAREATKGHPGGDEFFLASGGRSISHTRNCIGYLPTFTIKNQPNVGKYTIDGWYGHGICHGFSLPRKQNGFSGCHSGETSPERTCRTHQAGNNLSQNGN